MAILHPPSVLNAILTSAARQLFARTACGESQSDGSAENTSKVRKHSHSGSRSSPATVTFVIASGPCDSRRDRGHDHSHGAYIHTSTAGVLIRSADGAAAQGQHCQQYQPECSLHIGLLSMKTSSGKRLAHWTS